MDEIAYKQKFLSSFLKKLIKFSLNILKSWKYISKISIFSVIAYLVYKQLPFNNKIEIFCQKNKFNEYILNNLQPLNYKPTFYMPTCFLQMVYHHYFPRPIIKFKREYIKTEDGGVFSMDWVIDGNSKVNNIYKKLLVIFHGATGGSEAGYIREILEEFIKKDEYKLVVVHNRGISDTPLYTPLSFHASYFYDQKYSLEIIQQRFPDLFCFTLGVSMGANIFTKLISNLENDDKLLNYIRCFVSVSNPLNFLESEKRNRGSIMDKHLKNCLKKYYLKHKILRHNKVLESSYNNIEKYKNFRQIDSKFTIKIHKNFKNVDDYYKQSGCCEDLNKIQIPTLFINAKDDLLSPVDTLNFENFIKNDKIMMILSDTGGHVTFYHKNIQPKRWFINKAMNYMQSIHDLKS